MPQSIPAGLTQEHIRKALVPQLSGRSEGSIEFKHQNISAVLVEFGLPYIEGYKLRGTYQSLLAAEVSAFLDQNTGLLQRLAAAFSLNPDEQKPMMTPDLSKIVEDPPEKIIAPNLSAKSWQTRKVRKIDFAERDARNRHMAKLGEEFVYELEKYRLNLVGRDDLAQKVLWASRDIGDGLGVDILSLLESEWDGLCYSAAIAWIRTAKEFDWQLVHGTVFSGQLEKRIENG